MMDLVARISLQDNMSRRITRVTRTISDLGRRVSEQSRQLTGLKTQILGIAGAYASAQGAAKLFNATLGEAARYEAQTVAVEAIFNDKSLSDSYLKMVEKMAIDSPLLNSSEMLKGSKGLVAMTKDVKDLGKSWGIVEKLMVLDPTQGTEGATFALKEMFQGDSLSMVERFGLNKSELNRIKKLEIPEQIAELTTLLNGMGVTNKAINKMGQTTVGYWAQIQERAQTFMKSLGVSGNSKIGEVLGSIVDKFDSLDTKAIAAKIDAVVGTGMQKIIDFGKRIWDLRTPIIAVAKAVGTFAGVVTGIVLVAKTIAGIGALLGFLASPIGLIALGIIGIGVAFKSAYKHSEVFRGIVDKVVDSVKLLFEAFKSGGVVGVMEAIGFSPDLIAQVTGFVSKIVGTVKSLFSMFATGDGAGVMAALGFSPEAIAKVTSFIETVKTKVTEFVAIILSKWDALQPGIATLLEAFGRLKDTLSIIFTTLWSILEPIFSALMAAFKILADVAVIAFNNVIAPVFNNMMSIVQMMWKIVGPIFELLGAAIGVAFEILRVAWDTIIKPFVNFMTTVFKKSLELSIPIIEKIGGAFDYVGGIISKIAGWLKDFTSTLSSFRVPGWLSKLGGGGTVKFEESGGGNSKSHYHGIDYVPKNSYQATLHRGEKVLTAQENKESKQGGKPLMSVNFPGAIFNVRQESDIESIAKALAEKVMEAGALGA